MMLILAALLLAVLLPVVIFDLLRGGTTRRIGLRNVARRKGEAALVVIGSMLATALITGSLVVGNSFESSIRDIAQTTWGPTDELVITESFDDAQTLAQALEDSRTTPDGAELDGTVLDGTVPLLRADVAVGSVADAAADRLVEPDATLFEVDVPSAANLGGMPEVTGLAGIQTPAADGAVLNQRLANQIGVVEGDPIDLFVAGEPTRFIVSDVVPATGLAGFGDVIVAPGAFSGRVEAAGVPVEVVATPYVLVSNTGGVYEGVERTVEATSHIRAVAAEVLPGVEFEIQPVKEILLQDAEEEGAEMTELFGTVGGFSVIAGILLVINLFVMLAGERKVELGTMRALGIKRGHLLRSFLLEGAVYGVLAAAVGALAGIGVGAGVIAVAERLFASTEDIGISLAVSVEDLATGALIGLAISQLTVTATSLRLTKVNIIRALKDLPEPAGSPRSRRRLVVGVVGLIASAALFAVANSTPVVALLMPALALLFAIPLVARFLPGRLTTMVLCTAALAWSASVFGLMPDTMGDPDIILFLLQGVLLVGLATAIVASLDNVWLNVARRAGGNGGGIGTRLGLAHPLARPVRSALLVAMYALVLFTVTFMSVMNTVFQNAAPELATQAAGGYSVVVDSHEISPIRADQIVDREGVVSAAVVTRTIAELEPAWAEEGAEVVEGAVPEDAVERWGVTVLDAGVDPERMPALDARSSAFADDAAAWSAVIDAAPSASETGWLIVPEYSDWNIDDTVTLLGRNGGEMTLTVAGTTRNNWLIGSGLQLPPSTIDMVGRGPEVPARALIATSDADAANRVASALTGELPEQGVDAQTVLSLAQEETDSQEGFLRLLSGYLGLGLLIGIAGLGVVLVRSVRERRRQLGMLNAIGVPASQSRRAFVVEAAFIGLQGVLLGVGMGVLSAWQVLTRSTAFEEGLNFALPVVELLVLGAIALAASLLAAIGPARRAGNVPPAVALRVTG